MSRGKKVGLWTGGILAASLVIGTTNEPAPAPAEQPVAAAASDASHVGDVRTAAENAAVEKTAAEKAVVEKAAAEEQAKKRAAAEAKAKARAAKPVYIAPQPSTYYANCAAVRAAGADPIYAGQPGYSRKLDRDGDGIACE